jgi:hypothetical protein
MNSALYSVNRIVKRFCRNIQKRIEGYDNNKNHEDKNDSIYRCHFFIYAAHDLSILKKPSCAGSSCEKICQQQKYDTDNGFKNADGGSE